MEIIMSEILATGIEVKKSQDGKWGASCRWKYGKITDFECVQGIMETKYYKNSLSEAIDNILDCMKQMNAKRSDEIDHVKDIVGFALCFSGDPSEYPSIEEEATKRGWHCYAFKPESEPKGN